jgi:hypothetical protein
VSAKAGEGALSGMKEYGVDRHRTTNMPLLRLSLNRGRGAVLEGNRVITRRGRGATETET